MSIRKTLTATLAAVMALSMVLAGCGNNSTAPSGGTPASGASNATSNPTDSAGNTLNLAEDQTLNLRFLNPFTLDPNDSRNASEFQVLAQVLEPLTRPFTENGKDVEVPAGAESWEVSEDGLTWTFKLRENTWSDGVPVIAQHYADSFIRILDPEKAFSYAFLVYDLKNAEKYYNQQSALLHQKSNAELTEDEKKLIAEPILTTEDVGVKALDERTLQITLERVTPMFAKKIGFAALSPIRLDVIEKGGEAWPTDASLHVFCGPFVITDWVQENSMTLTKNDKYWDAENVHLNTVNMMAAEELSTRALLFESAQLDVLEGEQEYNTKWTQEAEAGKYISYKMGYPSNSYIVFNHKTGGLSGLMNNVKIKKALSLAIDREELCNSIYGRYTPAYGLIPSGITVGDLDYRAQVTDPLKAEYDEYGGDPAKLQALFQEGMKEEGMDKPLSEVTLTFLSSGTNALTKSVLEYFQQLWQTKLGIKIDLQVKETQMFKEDRNADKYDLMNQGWHGDYNDPLTFIDMWITEGGFSKFMGWYSSEVYDQKLKELAEITDDNARLQAYAELEKQLISVDAGIAPTYYADRLFFTQPRVKGIHFPSFGASIEFSRAYIAAE